MLFIIAYILTMVWYIHLRRRFAHHRFTAEGIVLVVAGLITLVTRFWFLKIPEMGDVSGGLDTYMYWDARILMSIYTVFGAFQFEGFPELVNFVEIYKFYFFISAAIYAGLVVISIVTAKISYEFYSMIILRLTRKRNVEVYVFADLNNDSLTLAKSIAQKHKSKQTCKIPFLDTNRCIIIFSGDNIKPFSSHDPLCVEVMKNSFFYYSNHRDNGTALLKLLGLLKPKGKVSIYQRKKIHFFALAQTEPNNVADEASNIDTIFGELDDIFKYYKKRDKRRFINRIFRFYVLTRDDLPYEKFEKERLAILEEAFGKTITGRAREFFLNQMNPAQIKKLQDKDELEKTLFNKLCDLFSIHIVNEANLTARAFSKKRSEILNKNNQILQDILQEDKVYLPLFLGFGKTNEKVLNQLYIDTAVVDKQLNELFFAATIVDEKLSSRIGIYSAEHPYYIVLPQPNSLFDDSLSLRDQYYLEAGEEETESDIIKSYKSLSERIIGKDYKVSPLPFVRFPLISYLEQSCTSDHFLNILDRLTGGQKVNFQSYNTIVIALGDDDTNINLANIIINDARKELLRGDSPHASPQLIAVHISNRNNYFKLQTADDVPSSDRGKIKNLNIISFGDVSELYSFDNIVDEEFAKIVNTGYETMSGYIYDANQKLEATITKENNALSNPVDHPLNLPFIPAYEQLRKIDKKFTNEFDETATYLFSKITDATLNEKGWINKNSFKKESNSQVLLYENTAKALAKFDIGATNKIEWLSANEHIRWNRLYIANGWRYNEKKYEPFLHHDCITTLDLVPELKNLYDIVNIALLVNLDKLRDLYGIKY